MSGTADGSYRRTLKRLARIYIWSAGKTKTEALTFHNAGINIVINMSSANAARLHYYRVAVATQFLKEIATASRVTHNGNLSRSS